MSRLAIIANDTSRTPKEKVHRRLLSRGHPLYTLLLKVKWEARFVTAVGRVKK